MGVSLDRCVAFLERLSEDVFGIVGIYGFLFFSVDLSSVIIYRQGDLIVPF